MSPTARAAVIIRAPRRAVWSALLAPETILQILPVTAVLAPWRLGETFAWEFDLAGKESRVEGRVTRLEAEHLLEYEYVDPHSRDVLGIPDNVHHVIIELHDHATGTCVTVTQDSHLGEAARAHAEGGWRLTLNHLKRLVEPSELTRGT